jgi:hypothetical protein
MSHRVDVALLDDVVPSPWTTICVVGAPVQQHRARQNVRLTPDVATAMTFPIFLVAGATRIQIEIESQWPAVIAIEDAALAFDEPAAFVRVAPERLEIFNGNRVRANPGASALCVAGPLIMQITGIDPIAFGKGARLRLRLRRTPVVPLGGADPVLAEFSRPESAVRSVVARLLARAEALAR